MVLDQSSHEYTFLAGFNLQPLVREEHQVRYQQRLGKYNTVYSIDLVCAITCTLHALCYVISMFMCLNVCII